MIRRAEAPVSPSQEPTGDLHTIDLFEALNAANSGSPVNQDTAPPADMIQRSIETPSFNQPSTRDVIQPTANGFLSNPEPDHIIAQVEAPTDEATVRRAVDEELLSLLESIQSTRSNPPPASGTPHVAAPPPAPPPIIQRQNVQEAIQQPVIQRAMTSTSQDEISTGSRNNGDEDDGVDVDRLARDVYKMLQNRLRIERERRSR
ncbi:MAG: hypothetical protein ABI970_01355, partial [Chloroflexota bacterium]